MRSKSCTRVPLNESSVNGRKVLGVLNATWMKRDQRPKMEDRG